MLKKAIILLTTFFQLCFATYILVVEDNNRHELFARYHVTANGVNATDVLLVISTVLLVISCTLAWSKSRSLKVASTAFLTLSFLMNCLLYVNVLDRRTGTELLQMNAGVSEHFQWARLTYWEPYFFLVAILMVVALILTALEYRAKKLNLR